MRETDPPNTTFCTEEYSQIGKPAALREILRNLRRGSPIPLCRDPGAMQSEQRRTDMSATAESVADAMGEEEKVGKLSARRMSRFPIDSIRGFGEYRTPFGSGVDVGRLVDTLQRIAISQRRDLFRFGFRFFGAESMCKAIAAASFGTYAHMREKEDCILLVDFRGQPRDQSQVYRPTHTKPVRKLPGAINGFQELPNQPTLLVEAVFGIQNGDGRRRETEFFADLHRDAHETYTVDFIVDLRGRMSIDYMESVRGGARRMGPYVESQTTDVGLRKVALSPMYTKSGKTRTFRNDPKTWKLDSKKKGYWSRAILPELERGRDRNDVHVALSRHMARRKKNERHLGDGSDSIPPVSGTPEPPTNPRKYPAGKRMM